jgi:hypothetical protein
MQNTYPNIWTIREQAARPPWTFTPALAKKMAAARKAATGLGDLLRFTEKATSLHGIQFNLCDSYGARNHYRWYLPRNTTGETARRVRDVFVSLVQTGKIRNHADVEQFRIGMNKALATTTTKPTAS